jgi:hypothetical protein
MTTEADLDPPVKAPRRKSERRRRGQIVAVRFDADEYSRIQAAARLADATAAAYLRAAGLKRPVAAKRIEAPIAPADLRKLLGEINKIGSNLNQLARLSNRGLPVLDADLDAALIELAELRRHLRTLLGLPP